MCAVFNPTATTMRGDPDLLVLLNCTCLNVRSIIFYMRRPRTSEFIDSEVSNRRIDRQAAPSFTTAPDSITLREWSTKVIMNI